MAISYVFITVSLYTTFTKYVSYILGEAVILEGMAGMAENNAILQTLQTKWKNISVDWDGGVKPSIN